MCKCVDHVWYYCLCEGVALLSDQRTPQPASHAMRFSLPRYAQHHRERPSDRADRPNQSSRTANHRLHPGRLPKATIGVATKAPPEDSSSEVANPQDSERSSAAERSHRWPQAERKHDSDARGRAFFSTPSSRYTCTGVGNPAPPAIEVAKGLRSAQPKRYM